ncbi:MAG: aldo/keto reductase [Acidobacteria bacterium]|nr:aldo/keto reductase [Acidobacteriota bacterium]
MMRINMERRAFLQVPAAAAAAAQAPVENVEWRNRQPGMSYRKLGRTGLMVSEIVSGGDPITVENYQHLNLALEMGLNYLDMAPAYNRGSTEQAYGKLIAAGSRRSKVFLTTKVSGLQGLRNQLYKEIYDGLPAPRQEAMQKRAADMMRASGVMKPGYFLDYYPGIRSQPGPAYLSNAMAVDFKHKVEDNRKFREFIVKSVEGSLQRVGTDNFDILMCPHGACCPEELDIPEIYETFLTLKRQGKVRFLGVTSHTDPAGVLRKVTQLGYYDCIMQAYNFVNGGYLEHAIREASAKGVGVIAMKVAMAAATHHKPLQPTPQWRVDMINRIVPGDLKAPMKAYLWALQNPNLTAVISNLWDETFVRENLSLAGKKVEFQPA